MYILEGGWQENDPYNLAEKKGEPKEVEGRLKLK